ncbi:MAG TPA: Spy/CpxP family protein refolding chaperone [Thermoanaerobaculia bacterium]|nr:Spy/CpxP family protein refolding chaperone [Thermoanaerobaculia bacterium]
MSRKRTSILLAVVVAGAALLATPFLFAAGKGLGMGERHGFGMHSGGARHGGHRQAMAALMSDLDLTREQKESLHAIFERTHERTEDSREVVHGAFLDAAKALANDPANVAAAKAALDARQPSIDALKQTLVEATAEAMAVLTPEQRARLVEHLERHAEAVPQ